jgi:hypothetical protein
VVSAADSAAADLRAEPAPKPTQGGFEAKLQELAAESSPKAGDRRQLLVRRWAEADPRAAAAWCSGLPEGPVQAQCLQQVGIAWAASDLAGASAWAAGLQEGEAKERVLVSLGYEAARTDPKSALQLASSLPASTDRDELIAHAVSQWAATDPAAASAWVEQVQDANLLARLVETVAIASAKHDPQFAGRIAAAGALNGSEAERATASVAQSWAQVDAEGAAKWAASLDNPEARRTALLAISAAAESAEPGGTSRVSTDRPVADPEGPVPQPESKE